MLKAALAVMTLSLGITPDIEQQAWRQISRGGLTPHSVAPL